MILEELDRLIALTEKRLAGLRTARELLAETEDAQATSGDLPHPDAHVEPVQAKPRVPRKPAIRRDGSNQGRDARPVRNVRTGETYKSARVAGDAVGLTRAAIDRAARMGKTAAGDRWVFVDSVPEGQAASQVEPEVKASPPYESRPRFEGIDAQPINPHRIGAPL